MKGFRTLFISALITLFGLFQQAGVIDLIPEEYRGLAISGIGFVMAILRMMTNTKPLSNN